MMDKTSLLLLLSLSIFVNTSAVGQSPNDKRLGKAREQYKTQIMRFQNSVLEFLTKNEAAVRREGDLEAVNVAKRLTNEYTEIGKLPENLPAATKRILDSAKSRLRLKYQSEIRALVRAGVDDKAELYKKELERLLEEPRTLKLADKTQIKITARKSVGYDIGPIAKGERFTLRYIHGKWKAWGRLATESPDSTKPERTDHCRVAIGVVNEKGAYRRLAIVPAGTAASPFAWKAKSAHERVILRINDPDGKFNDNPDDGVKYELELYRY